jgi:hypothetical protein
VTVIGRPADWRVKLSSGAAYQVAQPAHQVSASSWLTPKVSPPHSEEYRHLRETESSEKALPVLTVKQRRRCSITALTVWWRGSAVLFFKAETPLSWRFQANGLSHVSSSRRDSR